MTKKRQQTTATPGRLQRPRLYEQLADHIASFIEAQGLSPGDRLPPERLLAAELGVSRATLSREPATGNSLHLLVTERACVSGQSADGRIRVVGLEETDRDVRLVIGVERAPGDFHNCLGNPAPPYTVELSRRSATASRATPACTPCARS